VKRKEPPETLESINESPSKRRLQSAKQKQNPISKGSTTAANETPRKLENKLEKNSAAIKKNVKKEPAEALAAQTSAPPVDENRNNNGFNPLDNILSEIDAFDTSNKPPKKKREKPPKIGLKKFLHYYLL
jgi:hypothetical protein